MNESTFTIELHGERIRGILWTPDDVSRRPLVLAGHGFGQHKRALYPPTLAEDLTARGFAVAAIDAPHHGNRRTSDDPAANTAAWDEHWRTHGASRIAQEHAAIIGTLATHPQIDAARIGYFGLSLATQYGIGVLAMEGRIRAAVLGLFSLADPGRLMRRYAPRAGCPIFFIQQLDDELHAADRARALFDLIASPDKELCSSPGGHTGVPAMVFDQAYNFLAEHLTPDR
jgi:dienelactone hydrolase